jgi:hypothetical protein
MYVHLYVHMYVHIQCACRMQMRREHVSVPWNTPHSITGLVCDKEGTCVLIGYGKVAKHVVKYCLHPLFTHPLYFRHHVIRREGHI